jgi:inhibitor of KinA sporulation pathway (predicted exonuclease)
MDTSEAIRMHYLVIDLEATCNERHRVPREQTEIIEIGAVPWDADSASAVDAWQTFVRPVIHPRLTMFCTKLTSIVHSHVDSGPLIPVAFDQAHGTRDDPHATAPPCCSNTSRSTRRLLFRSSARSART